MRLSSPHDVLVAALGFISMAIATSPSGEVQRPLATVVGGIISSAVLALPAGALRAVPA